ncbi:MAG: HamA C-terminal domain-containing protein [Sulfitobacter sp.]
MTISFEVLFSDEVGSFCDHKDLNVPQNRLLSLLNDFEDGCWMEAKFNNFIWDNVALTALSKRERDALAGKSQTELAAAARNLRLTDKDPIGEGSEIAEIILYGIMHDHYGALPVVPKIFYKQNSQDNAKGSDGVHIVVDGDDFTIWFGEAKFYNSIEDGRLDSVVASVLTSLRTDKLKKENSIITSVQDLDLLAAPSAVLEKIKDALSPSTSIDHLKAKIHIPILLVHECTITGSTNQMTSQYRQDVLEFHHKRAERYFLKQFKKSNEVHKYADVHFHLILLPVPQKKALVNKFSKAVEFYQGN